MLVSEVYVMQDMTDYEKVIGVLSSRYEEVNGYDFYKYIFPNNENEGEYNTDYSKPNAVYLYYDEDKDGLKRRIMLNDTWESDYMSYVEVNQTALCSGLTYRKMTNKLENAQCMNALIFDLDSVGLDEIENILYRISFDSNTLRSIPVPTFVVASGSGVHLYYVFNEPIDLYPNIKIQLKSLKYDLTFRIWEYKATSKEKQIQYQSINQSFRMVGSINDKYDLPVRAFKIGKKVTLEYLNSYARNEENKVDINKRFKSSTMTLEEAKESYPEWYQRVVVEGNKNAKKWDIRGKQGDALYQWWRRQIGNIKGGHRYFYLMCMSIYACKCDVPRKQLKADMLEDFEILDNIDHKNKLSKKDIASALEMYSREFYNFPIDDIEKLTDVRIERNKRNGRKQSLHLKLARANRDIICEEKGKKWTDGNGRPKGSGTAEAKVKQWRENNPTGKKVDCHRETGLDPKTIRKWWEK